jgi:hypothetical protein
MAMKCRLENDEIGRKLIFYSDSDCCTEYEDNVWGYEDEDDELVQPSASSSPSLWGPPHQYGRRSENTFSGGAVGKLSTKLHT